MRLVVDANILFAGLIKDGFTRNILLEKKNFLYAPQYLLDEFSKNLSELEEKTSLSKEILLEKMSKLIRLSGIILIGEFEITETCRSELILILKDEVLRSSHVSTSFWN